MWFKKKSVLQADGHYDTEKSADGTTDLRTTWREEYRRQNGSINTGPPFAADAANYFFLPHLGSYGGKLYIDSGYGYYWSSSAYPRWSGFAYSLRFTSGGVIVSYTNRVAGCRVGGFE